MKSSLGNLAVDGVDHLAAIIRNRLKRIQYRPDLIPGFLTQTGLSLQPDSACNRNHHDRDRPQTFHRCT